MNVAPFCVNRIGWASNGERLPLPETPGEAFTLKFEAPAGLYQFSAILDARDFDWEQLYEVLNKFGNTNQRTGPWDFSINFGAIPLVPSYWVYVNDRRIGLWFFQRVSLEDIERRRFRGRMAFYAEGWTTVRFEPYHPAQDRVRPSLEDVRHRWMQEAEATGAGRPSAPAPKGLNWGGLRWAEANIEKDPEDALEPLPTGLRDVSEAPAVPWGEPGFWEGLRAGLEGTHAPYRAALSRIVAWKTAAEKHGPDDIVVLMAAERLGLHPGAIEAALRIVDRLVDMPAWGNPNPEGYSHNGDMGAMIALRDLAWAFHALRADLGDARRDRVLAKLRFQGETFFHLILLNRDYWGGSIVQDHGWRALFGFGAAALHLLGVLPEADRWVQYVIPRLRRSLEAMPRDGVIPPSSHDRIYLYMDEVTQYRDALLARTGEDIFDQPQFRPIVDYLASSLDADGRALLVPVRSAFIGGNHFLNRMASKFRDGRAAYLQRLLLDVPATAFHHPTQESAYFAGTVHGLLSFDPTVAPAAGERSTAPTLSHFRDSGRVIYLDREHGVVLSFAVGPYSGYNAYRRARCSCDRLGLAPGAGHFSLSVRGQELLCTPDGGYRLQSVLRTCLLIDGKGQYGDIGYPMSIPSWRDRGEEVETVRWDEVAKRGFARVNLQPAYGEEAGLTHYTRDFLLGPGARVVVRDTVVLDEPRRLSWLFQVRRDQKPALDGALTARVGEGPVLRIEPRPVDVELEAGIHETPVVWAYSSASGFNPFDHVRYDTREPVSAAHVDFVLVPE